MTAQPSSQHTAGSGGRVRRPSLGPSVVLMAAAVLVLASCATAELSDGTTSSSSAPSRATTTSQTSPATTSPATTSSSGTSPSTTSSSTALDVRAATLQGIACSAERFSVIVLSDEHGRSSAACGEDSSGHVVAVDDAFPIWSTTKMLTAATVLSLGDKGLVDLDAPVADYVDFAVDETITVRHLLSHKSGLSEGTPWSCDADATIEAMKDIAARGTVRDPGTPKYSTTGFMFASLVMATAADKDAGAVVREEVFEPLGMTESYFMATEEGSTPRGGIYGDGDTCPGTTVTLGTGGDIVSTPADLERFIVGLFSGNLLSAESLDTMLDMQSEVAGIPYGLGVGQIESTDGTDRSLFGHWGTTNVFEAGVVYDLESHATIVLILAGGSYTETLWQIADWAAGNTERDE